MKLTKPLMIFLMIAFLLSTSVTFAVQTVGTSRIAAYGDEAEAFASLIAENTETNKIIIVSDLKTVNLQGLQTALKNDTTLVAINLPSDNELTPMPTLQLKTKQTIYETNMDTNVTILKSCLENASKIVNPEYWISVIKYGPPLCAKHFLLMNNTIEAKEQMSILAVEATKEISQMAVSGNEYPGMEPEWSKKAELEYLLYWGPGLGELKARQTIGQYPTWDDTINREYWRVDSYVDSYLPTYEREYVDYGFYRYLHIGPYVVIRGNYIDGNIPYYQYSGLVAYGPATTPEDVGVDFHIGVDVQYRGASAGFSYGWSWTNPGVRYDVGPDSVESSVGTVETFRDGRESYALWPWLPELIQEPTPNSHGGYPTQFTAVMRTPVGSGFDISSLQTSWIMCDDYLYMYGGLFWAELNEYYWNVRWDPARLYSMFGSAPQYYYVSAVTRAEHYENGHAYNQDGVIGSSDDGQYTELYAGSYGSFARIWTTLNGQTNGQITIKGYSSPNCQSHLMVYWSTDNYNWNLVSEQDIKGTSPYWIDVGYVSSQFRYLLIIVYNNVQGSVGDLYIDAVRVYP